MKKLYGGDIDINNADVFTMMHEHSYAAFVGVLSNIFMKAHASSNDIKSPYNAIIIISESMLHPYKDQPESSFVRLTYIYENMKPAGRIVNLAVFLGDESIFSEKSKIGLKHTVSHCWTILNNYTKANTICINPPPAQLNRGANKVRFFQLDDIKKHTNQNNIVLVDYNKPVAKVLQNIGQSKLHICYQGGTSWLSVAMNIPTIIIHPKNNTNEIHLKFKLFGQELGNINILNKNNLIENVRMHPAEHHIHISELGKKLKELIK